MMAFLGRPALSVTLGAACGGSTGAAPAPGGVGRSHKRSRPVDWDGASDGPAGNAQQVVRAMLRAHKLGVLVPLVYHCEPTTGVAILEAVPGRRLADMMAQQVAATTGAGAAAAAAQGHTGQPGTCSQEPAAKDVKAGGALHAGAAALGRALARLHDGGQVHGSLSGETVLVRESDCAVVLTDFRRSFTTVLPSDKAEDLAGLEVALLRAEAEAEAIAAAAGDQDKETRAEAGGEDGAGGAAAEADGSEADGTAAGRASAAEMFELVLAAYRDSSRMWSATHNKLTEARTRRSSQLPPSKRPKTTPEAASAAAEPIAQNGGSDAGAEQ